MEKEDAQATKREDEGAGVDRGGPHHPWHQFRDAPTPLGGGGFVERN